MSLFVTSLCLALSHVRILRRYIVFCSSVESIHATLDLNSDMQCPWALGTDGYMNSILENKLIFDACPSGGDYVTLVTVNSLFYFYFS